MIAFFVTFFMFFVLYKHFFYHSTFSLPIKQKWGKLKSYLSSYFSTLPLFHFSNQSDPKTNTIIIVYIMHGFK